MRGSIWIDFDDYNDSVGYTPASIFVLVATAASFVIANHFTNWQTALKFSGSTFVAALILAWTIPRLVEFLANRQRESQDLRYELRFETAKQIITGKNDLRHRRKISIHSRRMTSKYMRISVRELRSMMKFLRNSSGYEEQVALLYVTEITEDAIRVKSECRKLLKNQDFYSAATILDHLAFRLATARYIRNLLLLNRRDEILEWTESIDENRLTHLKVQVTAFEDEHPLTLFSQTHQSEDSQGNFFGSGQVVHTSKLPRSQSKYR